VLLGDVMDLLGPCFVCGFYGWPAVVVAWVLICGRWIRTKQLGSWPYARHADLVADLKRRLGEDRTFVIARGGGRRLDQIRFATRLETPRREVSLSFFNTLSMRGRTPYVRIELQVDTKVRVKLQPGKSLALSDGVRVRQFFSKQPELEKLIRSAFNSYAVDSLLIWDGKLTATVPLSRLSPDDYPRLLARLHVIATAFEPLALKVRVLGGERRALKGESGGFRCAYCHDGITGEEPDLVACERCQTILHEGCWKDLGHCPVLGCEGRAPERPRVAPKVKG
jgi:hypothetical protein